MGRRDSPAPGGPSLRHVRAAQLRTRARRRAIGQCTFGTLFLLGALAHALGPGRELRTSIVWAALLIVLSTLHVGTGLRIFARVRGRRGRTWLWATLAWGLAATLVVRSLVRAG